MPLSIALTRDSENSGTDNIAETILITINSTTYSNKQNSHHDLFFVSTVNANNNNLASIAPVRQKDFEGQVIGLIKYALTSPTLTVCS